MKTLSDQYNEQLKKTLVHFCEKLKAAENYSSKKYSLFYPMIGGEYFNKSPRLPFIGKNTNGWNLKHPFSPAYARYGSILKNAIEWSYLESKDYLNDGLRKTVLCIKNDFGKS